MVFIEDTRFRPSSISPKYPPYHGGDYLEEYFFRRWNEEGILANTKYIDIFWTNIFCNSMFAQTQYPNIQEELDARLLPNERYFTVCQFDDGPLEKFSENTLLFSAGGNREGDNIIPIPLVCSSIPFNIIPNVEKKIFASFVGSRNTHPIRMDMCKHLSKLPDYSIITDNWSLKVPMKNFETFVYHTCISKFALAPRGYGKQSFRLYEILQLGAVPVYISNEHYLPWMDEIDWNSFCVPINDDEIEDIDDILKSIPDAKYNKMLEEGRKIYREYFTLESVFRNIVKRIV
jgi:hypothetical protein